MMRGNQGKRPSRGSKPFYQARWYLIVMGVIVLVVGIGDIYNFISNVFSKLFNSSPSQAVIAACKQPLAYHNATIAWLAAGRDGGYNTPEGRKMLEEGQMIAQLASLTGDAKLERMGSDLFQKINRYKALGEMRDPTLLRKNSLEIVELEISFQNRCDELGVKKQVRPHTITPDGNRITCDAIGALSEIAFRSLASTGRFENKLGHLSAIELLSVSNRAANEQLYLAALAVGYGYLGLDPSGNRIIQGLRDDDYIFVLVNAWNQCTQLKLEPKYDLEAFLKYLQTLPKTPPNQKNARDK